MNFLKKINNNKTYLIIFLFCLIMMLILILNETNIFYIIKEYVFNMNYRNDYINNCDMPIKTNINLLSIIKFELANYRWTYDSMLIWGTNIFQLILPIIIAVSALIFYNKNKSINHFVINRQKKYKSFLIKEIIGNSLKTASSIFLAYIIVYMLAIVISKGATNEGIDRKFLLDIIGTDFYNKNPQIYYLIDGMIRLFFVPLIYSIFSCAISLLCKNYKQVFLTPIICYFIGIYISLTMKSINPLFVYINPSLIMVPNYYSYLNSWLIFMVPVISILISSIIILGRNKHVEI